MPFRPPASAMGRFRTSPAVPAEYVSRPVLALLHRPAPIAGRVLGAGYVEFAGHVIAVTRPGAPRMPNGIGCKSIPRPGQPVLLGAGQLRLGPDAVSEGRIWDPVPQVRVSLMAKPQWELDLTELAGRGPGLTPYGDDLLAGYLTGLVLWGGERATAEEIAEAAAVRTTSLSAALLRHAARGELPEPAHELLEVGDPAPLARFGHSSGGGLMLGLALACPYSGPRGEEVLLTPPASIVEAGLAPAEVAVEIHEPWSSPDF